MNREKFKDIFRIFGPGAVCIIISVMIITGSFIYGAVRKGLSVEAGPSGTESVGTEMQADMYADMEMPADPGTGAAVYEDSVSKKTREFRTEITGADTERQAKDDRIMSEVMKDVLTWRGYGQYEAAWNAVVGAHPEIPLDGQFYSDFFPSPERVRFTDEEGNLIVQYIDDTYNTAFVSMESHILDINDGVYSYAAFVTSQSSGSVGGTASARSLWLYDVTFTGEIENLSAYIIGG